MLSRSPLTRTHRIVDRLRDVVGFGAPRRIRRFMRSLAPIDTGIPLDRIGGDGDGGYLIPRDTEGVVALFSPGVSTVANFELAFAERGVPCFLADRSVDGPPVAHAGLHFLKKHLGQETGPDTISLGDWVRQCCTLPGDLMLQMDIEGAEYKVLGTAPSDLLSRFRVIVLEVHDLHHMRRAESFERISRMFSRLLATHAVIHLHANNCREPRRWLGLDIHPVIEFTFLRRDRFTSAKPVQTLPHPLDASNVPGAREWPLDPNWLGGEREAT